MSAKDKIVRALVVLVGYTFLTSAAGWTFNPTDQSARWEVPRLGAPSQETWRNYRLGQESAPAAPAVADFADRYGGTWFYQPNRITGTYHHLYGSGIDLGFPLKTAQDVEAGARAFIRDNPGIFPVGNENLAVASCTNALGKWSIIFQETYAGLRVWGGRAHLIFMESGRLFEMGCDAHPGIAISTEPALTEAFALSIAKTDMAYQEGTDRVELAELMVLPVETGEAGLEYRLAYRFDLRVAEPLGLWATWIDAAKGEILWRENRIRFANFTGHVQGDIEWDGYCDGATTDYPIKDMTITVSTVGSTTTNSSGDFTITYGGTDSKTVTAAFVGPWVNVNRATGTDASHTGTITPGTPYTIDWSNTNSLASERDGFAYTNTVHDWIKAMDPAFTSLDYTMICAIERTDGYCPGNAWWDGTNINFCAQSSSYGNTARMGDVVYHEYGHGVTQELYGLSEPPGDVHEGNSDVIANLLTRESIMGLGFYLNNCTSGIRNSDNTIQYPCSGEDHYCGQLIAGFHWDAWQELLASYSQAVADSIARVTWHFGRKLGLPQSQSDQVHYTFVADDNDGNLANGTPHYNQFCTAATNHNFTCPEIQVGVFITHTPLGNTQDTSNPYPVVAVITSTQGTILVDSCRVTYRVDGGALTNVAMAATGNPNEYRGYIPAQQACSEVEYYIYARDSVGNTKTHPAGAPSSLHAFQVGYQTIFTDDFETNKGWTVGATGDNATTGIWERCDPEWTEAQPEDDNTAAPGVNAYITECSAGYSQGDYDVDGGKTTLLSPIFNLTGYDQVAVRYYRWYSNDTGATPGTDAWIVEVTGNGTTWVKLEDTKTTDRTWRLMQFNVADYVTLSSQVRFRFVASDTGSGSLVEAGLDDFSLVGCEESSDTEPPTVTVLDPNGGEEIMGGGGSTYDIAWTASDNVGVTLTKILLSTDGGLTYPDTLASGALASPWEWNVPDVDESACRIKIVASDAAGNTGSDQSNANFEIVATSGVPVAMPWPEIPVLMQNRPSPFAGTTEIEFGLPKPERVSLRVYAVDGRLVATLAEGVFGGGYHRTAWNGSDAKGAAVSAGLYFYRLETEEKTLTRKLLVVR